jgi:hypothetical protein
MGNKIVLLPDGLDIRDSLLEFIFELLVLFDFLVKFDNVRDPFLDSLGTVGGTEQI